MDTTLESLQTGGSLGQNFSWMRRLEKAEWWVWGGATTILLLLWLVLAVLASEVGQRVGPASRIDLDVAVHALLGLILLFSVHALYQQMSVRETRRPPQ